MAEDKKLIIDEDWKSQVEAEKQAAKAQAAAGNASGASMSEGTVSAGTVAAGGDENDSDDFPMPPASLEMLISTLVTEAMMALGQIPHPATRETGFRPHQAKYLIDTIAVLSEKTKGNITAEEEQAFVNLLHQLRMAFVALSEARTKTE